MYIFSRVNIDRMSQRYTEQSVYCKRKTNTHNMQMDNLLLIINYILMFNIIKEMLTTKYIKEIKENKNKRAEGTFTFIYNICIYFTEENDNFDGSLLILNVL